MYLWVACRWREDTYGWLIVHAKFYHHNKLIKALHDHTQSRAPNSAFLTFANVMADATDVRVLQADVDEETESEFRILVGGEFVKYLIIDAGLYDIPTMCFGPGLIYALPPLPPGDWNEGVISRGPTHDRPYFASVAKRQLPKIMHIWHPHKMDHLDLQVGQKLRTNVYEAATHGPAEPTIIVKFARFSWEIPQLDAETSAYEWIKGHSIGPNFLGHLTEEGRAIGFMIERITDCRHAGPEDLPLCQQVLSKLHQLGIKHGDINKHNFLIQDQKAILIDFDSATRCNDEKTLADEFDRLQQELYDTSGRGGSRILESSLT